MKKSGQRAFTVVELLIVIVVIGILAAITVVAYGAIQDKARASSAASDIANVSRKAGLVKAMNGYVTTPDLLTGENSFKISPATHRMLTVCANVSGSHAVVSEARNGNIYYSRDGGTIIQDNTLNIESPCAALGIASPVMVFGGMPATSCANEGGTCTFSDTQSIAYGSVARGQFFAKKNQTSPVTCSNAYFTDPVSGYTKSCYILQY